MVTPFDEDFKQQWQQMIDSNCVWIIDGVGYHPLFGSILPDGQLKISTAGRTDDEIWDGYTIISEGHDHYFTWRHVIENKEKIRDELKENDKRRRAERRRNKRERPNNPSE